MKLVYSRVRIALITFTLGLAAVWMSNALAIAWRDIPVDLPLAESSDVLFIFPIEHEKMPPGGRGCGGREMTDAELKAELNAERRAAARRHRSR